MPGMDDSFLDRLTELKNQHMEHIVNGGAESYDEYRHLCGVIKGVAVAEREFKELLSKVEG